MMNNMKKMFIELRPSNVHGIGIFAIRSIPKNTVIFNYDNSDVISYKYKDLRDNGVPLSVIKTLKKYCAHDKKCIEIPKDFDHEQLSYINYLNHSENPNIYFDFNKNSYITKGRIKPNEEILLDYKGDNYCKDCVDF